MNESCLKVSWLAYVSTKNKALFSDRLKQIWLQKVYQSVRGREELNTATKIRTGDDQNRRVNAKCSLEIWRV